MAERRIKLRTVLAASGLWPRRALRKLKAGVETADGRLPVDATIPLGGDWVELGVRDRRLRARHTLPPALVLRKPVDTVTSRRSSDGTPTVFDVLAHPLGDECEPVGRLDKDTTGVLIFTADGQLLHRLTHPKFGVVRTYEAVFATPLDPASADRLLAGEVELDDGHVPRPDRLDVAEGGLQASVDLTSGKYHEVRRMFAAAGSHVLALHRTSYAGVTVDDLEDGEWRRLDDQALLALYGVVGMEPARSHLEVEVVDG